MTSPASPFSSARMKPAGSLPSASKPRAASFSEIHYLVNKPLINIIMKTNQSKVVLITGASSGIGEATARHLAALGHTVVLGARRTDRLEKLAEEIRGAGGTVEYKALDVTSLEDTQAFADFAISKFGHVDVIINNAGVMPL